jgi:hypothetical protein
MTTLDRTAGVPALLARLLAHPDLLDVLARRDFATLRRELTAEPALLDVIAAIDVAALRFYLRRLQRKRLESIESICCASLPAARNAWGADALSADFWQWYQPPAEAAAHEVLAMVVAEWTRFAGHLALRGPPDWLGDLSRYEVMRWQAISGAAPPPGPSLDSQDKGGKPFFAPGTRVGTFGVDVPLLMRTAMNGNAIPARRTTRMITWSVPSGGIGAARLGAIVYEAVLACDGSRTIDQVVAVAAARREGAEPQITGALCHLVEAGALWMSAPEEFPAEREHSGVVQLTDGT